MALPGQRCSLAGLNWTKWPVVVFDTGEPGSRMGRHFFMNHDLYTNSGLKKKKILEPKKLFVFAYTNNFMF